MGMANSNFQCPQVPLGREMIPRARSYPCQISKPLEYHVSLRSTNLLNCTLVSSRNKDTCKKIKKKVYLYLNRLFMYRIQLQRSMKLFLCSEGKGEA
jgi:hypothetical protein